MKLTLNFTELGRNDAMIAGGKGASLGEMTQAGIPVPPGFVVLSTTFDEFIKEADLVQEIDAIIDSVNHKDINSVEVASEKIQALIKNAQMPDGIASEIKAKFKDLDAEFVAVRSSATAEDGADNAWAGQLDSFLNTKEANLLEKVQHCWASLFTPRAIFYRFEKGLHTTKISVAVVVQKMVNSEVSGIAFSVHPVTEDRNQMIIEAGFGLGEAIVSGSVTPDSYVIEKEPRRIIDINVSSQTRALYRVQTGGNEWIDIPEPKASSQVLTETQVSEFADLIMRIENHYGFPCDIEWAFETCPNTKGGRDGKFYIVQSRPITTLSAISAKVDKVEDAYNSFKKSIGKDEIFSFEGAWSLLLTAFPSIDQKFVSKYYKTKSTPLLFAGKGRNMNVLLSQTVYSNCADEIFNSFILGQISINDLEKSYQYFSEKIDELYKSKIVDPIAVFKQAVELGSEVITATVYIETFDKTTLERVIGQKVSEDLWNIAILPSFESFEHRWNKIICEAKSVEEVEYIFTDYYLPKKHEYISKQIKEKKIKPFPEHIKENQNKVSKIKEKWVEYTQFIMKLRDLRKDPIAKSQALAYRCAKIIYPSIADEVLANLCPLEIYYKLPSIEELNSRTNGVICYLGTDRSFIIETDNVEEKVKKITNPGSDQGKEIIGTVAYPGFVTGIVRVVKDADNFSEFNEGDILVTSMTRPEFVPLMRKSSAIITNEGGITCHAAIVSRELKIPCVIGTKIATKVLKDGDVVEVDANNGVVKIIK